MCIRDSIYYANIQKDFGAYPTHGVETGSLEIKFGGKILHKEVSFSGLGGYVIASHGVDFIGNKVSIGSTGNEIAGSSTYATTAVLYERNQGTEVELAREVVVCTQTWAIYP